MCVCGEMGDDDAPKKRRSLGATGGHLKHVKTSSRDYSLTFHDVTPLRRVLECFSPFVTHTLFRVTRSTERDDRFLLEARGEDHSHTCIVSARLLIDELTAANDDKASLDGAVFVLDTGDMLSTMRGPAATSGALVLQCYPEIPKVLVGLYNTENMAFDSDSILDTFDDPYASPPPPIVYNEYLLEIDTCCLRDFVNRANGARAEFIRITLYLKEIAAQTYCYMELTSKGSYLTRSWFCNEITRHEDGSAIVRAAEDANFDKFDFEDGEAPQYDHAFQLKKIEAFVKGVSARMIVARLKRDEAMLLSHPLAGSADEEQHLRFLIAYRHVDESEDD